MDVIYPRARDQIPYRSCASCPTIRAMRDGSGLKILDRWECLARLDGAHLGSVALSVNALPVVLPVAVALLDEHLVLRVRPDGVLARSMRGQVVSLLVCGGLGPAFDSGWSITATGLAEPIDHRGELSRCAGLPLPAWTADDVFVRVPTTIISGRAFVEPAGSD